MANVKSPGSIVDLMIEWCWPNMLNVTDCDYTTLPNFLAGTVKHTEIVFGNVKKIYGLVGKYI